MVLARHMVQAIGETRQRHVTLVVASAGRQTSKREKPAVPRARRPGLRARPGFLVAVPGPGTPVGAPPVCCNVAVDPIAVRAGRTGAVGRPARRMNDRVIPIADAMAPRGAAALRGLRPGGVRAEVPDRCALLGDEPRRRDLLIEHLHRLQDTSPLSMEHLRGARNGLWRQTEVYEVASHHHFDIVWTGRQVAGAADGARRRAAVRDGRRAGSPGTGCRGCLAEVRVVAAPCVGRAASRHRWRWSVAQRSVLPGPSVTAERVAAGARGRAAALSRLADHVAQGAMRS